jgi:hypothetical protein
LRVSVSAEHGDPAMTCLAYTRDSSFGTLHWGSVRPAPETGLLETNQVLSRRMPRQRVAGPSQKKQMPMQPNRPTRRMRKARQPQVVAAPAPRNSNLQGPSRPRAAPSAYSVAQGTSEPRISAQTRDGVRIVHRELVASIVGTANFNVGTTLALNPGITASFPWLSSQAQGWEQYRFNKLRFCYYSRCATSTPGSIMMVPDYDAADAAPTTEQIASAYRDVEEEVPWTPEFSCSLNVAAMHPDGRRKFVRFGNLAANLDIKTYDVGNMFVCTTDGSATNWGKLWVEYDVSLFVPQLQPAGVPSNPLGGSFSQGGSVTNVVPFGTAPVASAANTGVTMTGTAGSNNVLTVAQAGTYLLTVEYTGTGVVLSTPTAGTGVTLTQLISFVNSGLTQGTLTYEVVSTVTNGTITITESASTTISAAVAYIANAPASSL